MLVGLTSYHPQAVTAAWRGAAVRVTLRTFNTSLLNSHIHVQYSHAPQSYSICMQVYIYVLIATRSHADSHTCALLRLTAKDQVKQQSIDTQKNVEVCIFACSNFATFRGF